MRTHVLPLLVIALVGLGCGGGAFSDGSAGAAADDASVQPDGASGAGGKAGAGGSAGAGNGGTAGAAGTGGAQDASVDGEAGIVCPGEQKVCGTKCVDLSSNPEHCGECDHMCSTQTCKDGQCVLDCGTAANCSGACVVLSTDLNNCGQCGNACPYKANQTPSCASGQCLVECNDGWEDCNNNADDGCESNLQTDPTKCGSCLNACSYPNGKAACNSGGCVLESCNTGFATCDGNATNGCEIDVLNDANNCGDCNIKCAPPNGVGICNLGQCGLKECLAGFADCDGNLANGCETKTSSDVFNCGACGRDCSGANVEAMMCVNGACASSCDWGYANCTTPSAAQDDNGCETSAKSQKYCGSCTNDCSTQGASPFSCLTNSAVPVCGCTSDAQCGGSGTACSSGLCKCAGSSTTTSCRPGEACKLHSGAMVCACNQLGPCTAEQTCCAQTGCVNVMSDINNCGGCGHVCAPGFTCSAGKCACSADASCNAGTAGTCSLGVCSCATKCTAGQRCLPDGTCG